MAETLPAIERPNGKLYRPRRLRVVGWHNEYGDGPECQVAVLGTHDVEVARATVSHGYRSPYLVHPTTSWMRLGINRGEDFWFYDEERGAACVVFDESDDPPEDDLRGVSP